jgi:hypothetical protein
VLERYGSLPWTTRRSGVLQAPRLGLAASGCQSHATE